MDVLAPVMRRFRWPTTWTRLPQALPDRLPGFRDEETLIHIGDHGGKFVHRDREAQRRSGYVRPCGDVEHPEHGPWARGRIFEVWVLHNRAAAGAERAEDAVQTGLPEVRQREKPRQDIGQREEDG